MSEDDPELRSLRETLAEQEARYAERLAALDRAAAFPLPLESSPDLPARVARLNEVWRVDAPPASSGLAAAFDRRVFRVVAPALQRQTEFNAALVQAANGALAEAGRLHGALRDLAAMLVRYAQRVLPLIDARDREAAALAVARAELILESFDRRLGSLGRRVDGLRALSDRLETLGEEVRALASDQGAAPPSRPASPERRDEAAYAAFESRFRGDRDTLREKLAGYLPLLAGLAPVLDLGCGRGEFLELLKEHGLPGRGVDGNLPAVEAARARGLEATHGHLLASLREAGAGSLGAVTAFQVAEHLPPAVLGETLRQAHRVLRAGGLLLLETVNPRSVFGLVEVFHRDLTHERALHPDTLAFLAAAAGFLDVRVEYRAPVDPSTRLSPVPAEGLPPRAAAVLNENLARLNAFLYGPQEYVLLARR